MDKIVSSTWPAIKRFIQKRWVWLAIGAVILVFLAGLAASWLGKGTAKTAWSVKLFQVVRVLRKTTDILFLPYYFERVDLPVYNLTIESEDYQQLNENLPPPYADQPLTDEYKRYVPAVLTYAGADYQVKVHYRGENSSHWSAPQKSWKIKLDSEQLIDGMTELNLIVAFDRYYTVEEWSNWRAKKMGLWVPKSRVVKLVVNGKAMGVYWETEGWDKEMLEKNQRAGEANLYQTREGYNSHRYYDNEIYWDKFTKDTVNPTDNYAEIQLLLGMLKLDPIEFGKKISGLVEMDNFYRWQIHSLLVGSPHQLGDNLRLYFDNTKGKFEFVPWDVGPDTPDQEAIDKCSNKFLLKFLQVPELVFERNKRLWEYVKNDDNLNQDLRVYDEWWNRYKAAFYQDRNKIKSNFQALETIKHYRQNYIDGYKGAQSAFGKVDLTHYFGRINDGVISLNLTVKTFGAARVDSIKPVGGQNYEIFEDTNRDGILGPEDKQLTADNLELILTSNRGLEGTLYPINMHITIEETNYKYFVKGRDLDLIKDFEIKASNYFTGQPIL